MNNLKKTLSAVLAVAMMVTSVPFVGADSTAENPGLPIINTEAAVPDHSKTIVYNDDGTYTITLSVTGDSDIVEHFSDYNVILVMDVSGSMGSPASYREISNPSTTGSTTYYGEVNGVYLQVYRNNNQWCYWAGDEHVPYTGGKFYVANGSTTRMEAAKAAAKELADNLLSKNTASHPDAVELAIVQFNHRAAESNLNGTTTETRTHLAPTTDKSAVNDYVNGLAAGGGTNWEDALRKTIEMVGKFDNDKTYVIFVSDGNPTSRMTAGYTYTQSSNGTYGLVDGEYIELIPETTYTYTRDNTNGTYGLINGEYVELIAHGLTSRKSYYYAVDPSDNDRTVSQYAHIGDDFIELTYSGGKWKNNNATYTGTRYKQYQGTRYTRSASETTYTYVLNGETVTYTGTRYAYTAASDSNSSGGYGNGGEVEKTIAPCLDAALDEARDLVNNPDKSVSLYTLGVFGTVENLCKLVSYAYGTESTDGVIDGVQRYQSVDTPSELTDAFSSIVATFTSEGIEVIEISDGTTENVKTTAGIDTNLLVIDKSSFIYTKNDEIWEDAPAASVENGTVIWNLSELGVLENGVDYTVSFTVAPSQTAYDIAASLENGTVAYTELDENIRKYIGEDGSLRTNTDDVTLKYIDTRVSSDEITVGFTNPDPVPTSTSAISITKKWQNDLDSREAAPSVTLTVYRDGEPWTELNGNGSVVLTQGEEFTKTVRIATGLLTEKGGIVTVYSQGHDYLLAEGGDLAYNWELKADTVHPMIINGVPTVLRPAEEDEIPAEMENKDFCSGYYRINGKVYVARDEGTSLEAINYRRSNLNITKEAEGYADPDTFFTFDITITDPNGSDIWFSVYDGTGYVTLDTNAAAEITDGKPTGYYYVESGTTFTVKMKAGWNLRSTNLLTGTAYTISEKNVPENFTVIENGNVSGEIGEANTSYTVTVKNRYELRDITVFKEWNDGEWSTMRDDVEITLYADGTEVGTKTIGKDDSFCKWTDLKTYNENGKEIVYTAAETDCPDCYSSSADSPAVVTDGKVTVTNTIKTVVLTVEKAVAEGGDESFDFTAVITLPNGMTETKSFSLGDGENKKIAVPYGSDVRITEETDTNGDADPYYTDITFNGKTFRTDSISTGSLFADSTVSVLNTGRFYVAHSAGDRVDEYLVKDFVSGFNITSRDHLFGNLFIYGGIYTDGSFETPYENINGRNGLDLLPHAGETFYVREVNRYLYLCPIVISVARQDGTEQRITDLYLTADIDCDDYKLYGFSVTAEGKEDLNFEDTKLDSIIEMKIDETGETVNEYKANYKYGMVKLDASGWNVAEKSDRGFGYYSGFDFTVTPYWVTADNVRVTNRISTFRVIDSENTEDKERAEHAAAISSCSEFICENYNGGAD